MEAPGEDRTDMSNSPLLGDIVNDHGADRGTCQDPLRQCATPTVRFVKLLCEGGIPPIFDITTPLHGGNVLKGDLLSIIL